MPDDDDALCDRQVLLGGRIAVGAVAVCLVGMCGAWALGCGAPGPVGAQAASVATAVGAGPAAPGYASGAPAAGMLPTQVSPGAPTTADNWRCGGELVPPTGWQQETAFEDGVSGKSRESASQKAATKLLQRLCPSATECEALASYVRTWKTGSNGQASCAMAVVSDADLADWRERRATLGELDKKLAVVSDELLQGAASNVRLTVDRVRDGGVPGGARADWLRSRIERFLQKKGTVTDPPKGWAGDGVPTGLDVVVRGDIVRRPELGVSMLESNWYAVDRAGRKVRASPAIFPEQASPAPGGKPSEVEVVEDDSLSVRMDAMRGGSLCAGDRTQIWLRAKEPFHVRVFNLYGDHEALLVLPRDDDPRSLIPANQTVPIGGRLGFEAVPVPGHDEEQFLVIAARSEAALGPFKSARGLCRVGATVAKQLHEARGFPAGTKTAVTGYRLAKRSECAASSDSGGSREGVVAAIQSLPTCDL